MRLRLLVFSVVLTAAFSATVPAFAARGSSAMPDLPGMKVAGKAALGPRGLPGMKTASTAASGRLAGAAARGAGLGTAPGGAGLGQADPSSADPAETPAPLGDLPASPAPEMAAASDSLPSTGAPVAVYVLIGIALLAFGKLTLELRPRRARA